MHRDAKHTNPRGLDVILKSATTLGKKHSKLQLSLRVLPRDLPFLISYFKIEEVEGNELF